MAIVRGGLSPTLLLVLAGLTLGQQTSAGPAQSGGYLFLNGQYVPPPYQIEAAGNSLTIQGQRFSAAELGWQPSRSVPGRQVTLRHRNAGHVGVLRDAATLVGRGQGDRKARPTERSLQQLALDINARLRVQDAVILGENHAPLFLEESDLAEVLLRQLVREKGAGPSGDSLVPHRLSSESDRRTWAGLVSGFQPSEAFLQRAQADLMRLDRVHVTNTAAVSANLWIDQIGYPLTMLAMVLVVLGFGHLMSNKPRIELAADDAAASQHTRQVVGRSLLIFALLSIVDLLWTLAASQAGSIREMNPLGNRFIDDPWQLIAFKTIVVVFSAGLLYRLHQRPIAQVASWWSCLVLTLLTARWLTFQSMFLT
jgi:hypothetical protein